jgi:hypothetical protein
LPGYWYFSGTGSPNQDAGLNPRLRMDGNGRLLPDTVRSTDNRELYGGANRVWTANVPGSNDRYVALFNRGGASSSRAPAAPVPTSTGNAPRYSRGK